MLSTTQGHICGELAEIDDSYREVNTCTQQRLIDSRVEHRACDEK